MNGSVFFPFFFFRYHYTKGADAAGTETAASLLTTTLRGTTTRSEKTLRFQASLQAEWSQNNLPFIRDIRGHSNPGNRFFSSSFFIYFHLFFLPSFLPSFLPFFLPFHRLSVPTFLTRLCLSTSNYFRSLASSYRRQCIVSIQRKRKTCQLEKFAAVPELSSGEKSSKNSFG